MVVRFVDSNTGTAVYINPEYVMSLRPDPVKIESGSIVSLRNGETIRVEGAHEEVAAKLARTAE
jgi:hypothetical protein